MFGNDINNNMNRKGRKNKRLSKTVLQLTLKNLKKICNTKVCLKKLSEKEIEKWQRPRITDVSDCKTTISTPNYSKSSESLIATSTTSIYNKDIYESNVEKNNTAEDNLKNGIFKSESITQKRFQNAKTKKIKTALIKAYQDEMKENEIKLETPPKSPNEQLECYAENVSVFTPNKINYSTSEEKIKKENNLSDDTYLTPVETEGSVTENDVGDSDESPEQREIIQEKQTIVTGVKCDECKFVAKNLEMLSLHKRIMHNLIRRQSDKVSSATFTSGNISAPSSGKGNEFASNFMMKYSELSGDCNLQSNSESSFPKKLQKSKVSRSAQSSNRRKKVRAMHLECALCGYTSPKRHHLNDHLNKHVKFYAYSCSECSHKSYTTDAMRKHIKVRHSKDTKYESKELKDLSKLFRKKFGLSQSQTRLVVQPLPHIDEQISVNYPVHLLSKSHLNSLSFNSMAFGNDSHETITNRQVKFLNKSSVDSFEIPESRKNISTDPFIASKRTSESNCFDEISSPKNNTDSGSKLKEIVKIQLQDELSKATCTNVDIILRNMTCEDVKNLIFQCKHCNYRTQQCDDLQNHLLKYHNQIVDVLLKQLVCKGCQDVFSSRYHMTKHIENFHKTDHTKGFTKMALKLTDHWSYTFS